MILTIDNNDGAGGRDYTQALLAERPLTITRRRDAWAECSGGLDLAGTGLPLPVSRAAVLVSDDSGGVLFRGFLQSDAAPEGNAEGQDGWPVFHALEYGWLSGNTPEAVLQPAGTATHTLATYDSKVAFEASLADMTKDLATDVTVAGGYEAGDYVTELFRGDGTTASFTLGHAPFRAAVAETVLDDSFDGSALNAATWTRTDTGNYVLLGSGGLRLNGGDGNDGTTLLSYAHPLEMGAALVAEARGLMLSPGSDGMLLGFYNGAVTRSNCVAGVRVRGVAGAQSLVALINGNEQTTTYNFAQGHSYTLRVRLCCTETQRVCASFATLVDGMLQSFGGGTVNAPLRITMEVQDEGLASSTLPTVLYDGAMASSPAQCTFALVNSTALLGSIARATLLSQSSLLVVSTATDGTVMTRREGASGTGADYAVTSTGVLNFDPGRVPQPGELVTATYRRSRRAVARCKDANADQLRLELALPGLPIWNGRATEARSTADCAAAAQALLALATGASTGFAGNATWVRGAGVSEDVAIGDTLQLQSPAGTRALSVQALSITDGNTSPETLYYRASFRQSRAASLSFQVEEGLPTDVSQPVAITANPATLPASLSGLQVIIATGSALQIDSGVDPPDGGGFEVRRSAANFGAADTSDLVLQSPVRGFAIPRLGFAERFFVRMYDGSTPRRYSPLASEVLTSLPLS